MAVPAPEELALVYWYQPGTQGLSSMNSSGYQDPASGLSCPEQRQLSDVSVHARRGAAGMQISAFNFLRDVTVAIGDQPTLMAGGAVADQDYSRSCAHGCISASRWARPTIKREFRWCRAESRFLAARVWRRPGRDRPADSCERHPGRIVGVTAAEFRGLSKGGFFPQTDVTLPMSAVGGCGPHGAMARRSFPVSATTGCAY